MESESLARGRLTWARTTSSGAKASVNIRASEQASMAVMAALYIRLVADQSKLLLQDKSTPFERRSRSWATRARLVVSNQRPPSAAGTAMSLSPTG